MKIDFEDKSFIEFTKSPLEDKIFISIGAKDSKNNLSLIINSVEISKDQLSKLVESIK